MYIVCHKCAAAYSVEDRDVTPRSRTQCPNCLHLQPVGGDRPAPGWLEDDPTVVRPMISIPSLAPAVASPFRVPSIAPVSPPPAPPRDLAIDDSLLAGAAQAPERVATHCRECGAALADAFDRALGICEMCRTDMPRAGRPTSEMTERDVLPQPIEEQTARRAFSEEGGFDGFDDPPAALEPQQETIDGLPESPYQSDSGPETELAPFHPGDADGEPEPFQEEVDGGSELLEPDVRRQGWRPGRGVVAIAVSLVIVFGGAWLRLRRHPAPVRAPAVAMIRLDEPWESLRKRWSPKYPTLTDDALKLLKQGEYDLARDTPVAYAEAEADFQKSFLVDPSSDTAVAGYIQALCLGRRGPLDESEYREVLALIEAAEKRSGRAPRVLIAHATLLLSRGSRHGSTDSARDLSQEAVVSAVAKDKAVAYLALGRAFLPTSAELAIQNIDQAVKLDPLLRRAYYYRALARETVGDYGGAIADLEKRLSLDADQSDAVGALARIYQESGKPILAHAIFEQAQRKNPRDIRAAIGSAVIQYQTEQKPEAAAAVLSGLLSHREDYRPEDTLELLVHLAAAERLAGKPEAALRAAEDALAISDRDAGAHLQLFMLALQGGDPAEAARHIAFLKQRIEDPALEKLLEGRLLLAEGNAAEAAKRFSESAELDSRRVDALLLAGAAAATAGQRDSSFQYLVKAGQMDPTRSGPLRLATRFYLRPDELLNGAEGRVIRLGRGTLDVAPKLYEGLIRFHKRDFATADKLLREVVDIDVGNAVAHSLRAVMGLNRGPLPAARTSAERAVRAGRGVALAHYAYGVVLTREKALEQAQKELREAEVLAPTLLATQVALADVEAKSRNEVAARDRLVHVLRVDPTYLPAKRALFSLER